MMNPSSFLGLLALRGCFVVAGVTGASSGRSPDGGRAVVWSIGEVDASLNEFALAPGNDAAFLDKDFGWEDRFFLVGLSDPKSAGPAVAAWPVSGRTS